MIVIGYPALVALTFFMFPITIGGAAWIALKKVKEGEIPYTINVSGNGEFGRLASDINSITDGLSKAVENELKSERLKTELITRVYIDVIDLGTGVTLTIKNISAYELNISSEELMERFKRGDESRGSQGSGLGLSITKSLIEIQKGSFHIEIDVRRHNGLLVCTAVVPPRSDHPVESQSDSRYRSSLWLGATPESWQYSQVRHLYLGVRWLGLQSDEPQSFANPFI